MDHLQPPARIVVICPALSASWYRKYLTQKEMRGKRAAFAHAQIWGIRGQDIGGSATVRMHWSSDRYYARGRPM